MNGDWVMETPRVTRSGKAGAVKTEIWKSDWRFGGMSVLKTQSRLQSYYPSGRFVAGFLLERVYPFSNPILSSDVRYSQQRISLCAFVGVKSSASACCIYDEVAA